MSSGDDKTAGQVGSLPRASVVIPAHDEGGRIGECLAALQQGVAPGELEVVVVCNGCTDDTAARAAAFPEARVVELDRPSKAGAVRVGNAVAETFPRVHLDADVRLTGADVLLLVAPLADAAVLATAPRRVLRHPSAGRRLVRWYYDVWEALPQVRAGLFGRGAYAVSATGQARVSALPELLSDDLAASEAFADQERRIVDEAVVEVRTPGTLADLVRRRTRVVTGVAQAASAGATRPDSATTPRLLGALAVHQPGLALRLPVFLGVTLVARRAGHRAVLAGDFTTWLRDESSRA